MDCSKIWINEGKILVKTIENGDGTYSQYDNDGDTYFKAILIEEYFEKMRTYFTDIKKESKSTRSWWKMKLIVGVIFEYDTNSEKVQLEMYSIIEIYNINGNTIKIETNSDVSVDNVIKSIRKEYNHIDEQMEKKASLVSNFLTIKGLGVIS